MMTKDDTVALMAYLNAAYPNAELPAETVKMWCTQLARVLPEDAKAAADLIIRREPYFPSLARMIDAIQACARSRALERRDEAIEASTDPPVSKEEALENIRRIRELLPKVSRRI